MRITHGRYILTSRDQIERALQEQRTEIQLLRAQLDVVGQWTRRQLELHQPYIHQLDVSCHKPEDMRKALAAKIEKDIWCSRCSNPWPCRHIANLRILRDLSRHFDDINELKGFAEEMNKAPKPERREGQMDVGL